jgi:hypothetical protein
MRLAFVAVLVLLGPGDMVALANQAGVVVICDHASHEPSSWHVKVTQKPTKPPCEIAADHQREEPEHYPYVLFYSCTKVEVVTCSAVRSPSALELRQECGVRAARYLADRGANLWMPDQLAAMLEYVAAEVYERPGARCFGLDR